MMLTVFKIISGSIFSGSIFMLCLIPFRSTRASDNSPNTITTCYNSVVLTGKIDELEAQLEIIRGVITIHNKIYGALSDGRVSIGFLVSVSGVKDEVLRFLVSEESLRRLLELEPNSREPFLRTQVNTSYLGCNTISLGE